jgi:hypothetical protein
MVAIPFRKEKKITYNQVETNNLRLHIPNFISNVQTIFFGLAMGDSQTLYTLSISNKYLDQVAGIKKEYNIIKSILDAKGTSWNQLDQVYISLNKIYDFNFNKVGDDAPKRVDVQKVNQNFQIFLSSLETFLDNLPKALGKNFDSEDILFGTVVRGIDNLKNSIGVVRTTIKTVPNNI